MTAPPLIGLMGQKRSGKDTAAAALIEHRGFVRLAFADALREVLLAVDPYVGKGGLRVSDVVDVIGWEGAKGSPHGPEIRRLLQELGVAVREVREDAWVQVVMRQAAKIRESSGGNVPSALYDSALPVVVTDVRFPNEADAIRAQGGVLVRIDRPSLPDDDGHPSEHAWREIRADYTVTNEGTLDDLQGAILFIADRVVS